MQDIPSGRTCLVRGVRQEAADPVLDLTLLTGDRQLDFTIKTDPFTAGNLRLVLDEYGGFRFRLSFRGFQDEQTGGTAALLVGIRDDETVRRHFRCSREFLGYLSWLKDPASSQVLEERLHPERSGGTAGELSEGKDARKGYIPGMPGWFRPLAGVAAFLVFFLMLAPGTTPSIGREVPVQTLVPGSVAMEEPQELPVNAQPLLPDGTVLSPDKALHRSVPEGMVALTFDDGPSQYTLEIARVLEEEQVAGTFFLIGRNMEKHPDTVRIMGESVHSLGHHSYGHPDFTGLSREAGLGEHRRMMALFEELTGKAPVLFRPPYGAQNTQVLETAGELGMKVVLWNLDTRDWDRKNARQILDSVMERENSGTIILLHESRQTLEALPEMIRYLKGQNLTLVGLE